MQLQKPPDLELKKKKKSPRSLQLANSFKKKSLPGFQRFQVYLDVFFNAKKRGTTNEAIRLNILKFLSFSRTLYIAMVRGSALNFLFCVYMVRVL